VTKKYSKDTGDLFEGVELDKPRVVPPAGETWDIFDGQPKGSMEQPGFNSPAPSGLGNTARPEQEVQMDEAKLYTVEDDVVDSPGLTQAEAESHMVSQIEDDYRNKRWGGIYDENGFQVPVTLIVRFTETAKRMDEELEALVAAARALYLDAQDHGLHGFAWGVEHADFARLSDALRPFDEMEV